MSEVVATIACGAGGNHAVLPSSAQRAPNEHKKHRTQEDRTRRGRGGMTIEFIVFALGALLLLIGVIGGGFELKEIKIPPVGWIARALSSMAGVILILVGISMVAQSAPNNQSPSANPSLNPVEEQSSAVTFKIFDALGPDQLSERVTVLLDGQRVGDLVVNSQSSYAEITVTVPEAGQYSYSVEAMANFFDATTGRTFPYTGVGQGMIQVGNGSSFRLVGSVSGSLWLVTLVES